MLPSIIENSLRPVNVSNIRVRLATMDDLAFVNELQKKHTKQVGFMPFGQIEGKIRNGHVLVAETTGAGSSLTRSDATASELRPSTGEPARDGPAPGDNRLGYVMGNDQYLKRDDLGIIYQMNVVPEARRSLVAATLLKAMFEKAAWGCRLFCCWCAQDIEANKFWEAMGFRAIAFRAGSEKKSRTHIFWQKRIVEGDTTTPWWFPSKTSGGAIGEERLVLPIPQGVRWNQEMPRLFPNVEVASGQRILEGPKPRKKAAAVEAAPAAVQSSNWQRSVQRKPSFASPAPPIAAKPEKAKRVKKKHDPQLVRRARELRDRWLEQVNQIPMLPQGKYRVERIVGAGAGMRALPLIDAA